MVTGLSIQLTVVSVLDGLRGAARIGYHMVSLFLAFTSWPIGVMCTWIGNKGMQLMAQPVLQFVLHVPLVLSIIGLMLR